jgi:hypothetical protein
MIMERCDDALFELAARKAVPGVDDGAPDIVFGGFDHFFTSTSLRLQPEFDEAAARAESVAQGEATAPPPHGFDSLTYSHLSRYPRFRNIRKLIPGEVE